jgi:hypothetical protein
MSADLTSESGDIEVWEPVSAAAIMARQLQQDDEIKHRLRLAGIDLLKLTFEERQKKILTLPAPTNGLAA